MTIHEPDIAIAADVGNTKSHVAVLSLDGTLQRIVHGGCGDIHSRLGEDVSTANVLNLIATAQDTPHNHIVGMSLFMAGVDWPEDVAHWHTVLHDIYPSVNLRIKNDGLAAIRSVNLRGDGIACTLGTGVTIALRWAGREYVHTEWVRGALGASGIGGLAIDAIIAAELGDGPPTALSSRVLAAYEVATVEELIHSFNRRQGALDRFYDSARCAPAVSELADHGDPVAQSIAERHAQNVVTNIAAALRRTNLERTPMLLTFGGSVHQNGTGRLPKCYLRAVAAQLPQLQLLPTIALPIHGAAMDALSTAGATLTDALSNQVRAQLEQHLQGEYTKNGI